MSDLHAVAIGLGAWLLVLWAVAVVRLGVWRELHHAYYGAALLAAPWPVAYLAGLAILADDAVQHVVQLQRPAYFSPLHRAYVAAVRATVHAWRRGMWGR